MTKPRHHTLISSRLLALSLEQWIVILADGFSSRISSIINLSSLLLIFFLLAFNLAFIHEQNVRVYRQLVKHALRILNLLIYHSVRICIHKTEHSVLVSYLVLCVLLLCCMFAVLVTLATSSAASAVTDISKYFFHLSASLAQPALSELVVISPTQRTYCSSVLL